MPKLPVVLPVIAVVSAIAAYFGTEGFSWWIAVAFFGAPLIVVAALFVVSLFGLKRDSAASRAPDSRSGAKDVSTRDI